MVKNIVLLTAANLRKSIGQSIGFILFVLFSAMFLYIGLMMFFGIGRYFDERAEALNTPYFASIKKEYGFEERLRYIEEYPGVYAVDTQEMLMEGGWPMLFRASGPQANPMPLVGDALPLEGNAIYINYFYMPDGAYSIGDIYRVDFVDTQIEFTVAGFFEDILFAGIRYYISDEAFDTLWAQYPEQRHYAVSGFMENPDDADWLVMDYFREPFETPVGFAWMQTLPSARSARLTMPTIVGIIITVFALLLLAVNLIVIRFRIINSIEESMVNIGALKAVGYRSRQIILSFVAQFALLAFAGGLLGLAASQFLLPPVADIIAPEFRIPWNPGFDPLFSTLTIVSVLAAVWVGALLSARRIKKLHPLTALRGGAATHSFKKNPLPLETAITPLSFSLAVKHLFRNKKQAIMLSLIIALVTFASVAVLAMHYNVNINREAYIRVVFGENPDVFFSLDIETPDQGDAFIDRLRENPDVRKAFGFRQGGMIYFVGEREALTQMFVIEDPTMLEGGLLIRGRYPKHDNEIALGARLMELNGYRLNDVITVSSGTRRDFVITGIIQHTHNNGHNALVTTEAARIWNPNLQYIWYYAYLHDHADPRAFLDGVTAAEGDLVASALISSEEDDENFAAFGNIFASIAAGVLAVTLIVVVLVLYMVIKTTILHRRRELGIQKALGFTTVQLMNQIALNLTPAIIIGIIIGAIGAYAGFNPIFVALSRSSGVVQSNMPIPPDWTILVCVALAALAYGVSMLIAWRIRKISAYMLISE